MSDFIDCFFKKSVVENYLYRLRLALPALATDHLGNTRAVITDRKLRHTTNCTTVDYYVADVKSATYYSSYGATAKQYNQQPIVAFNGQRKSSEIGNDAQTALYWEYNCDVGRRWSVDPKPNISISPYNTFSGNPIWFSDNLGDTIHDNTGYVKVYKAQAQERIKTIEDMEKGILKKDEKDRKDWENRALPYLAGAKSELQNSLNEIDEMEKSPVHIYVNTTTDEKMAFKGEGATALRANMDEQRVEVDVNFNTIGGERSVVGHELKHVYQAMTGRTNNRSLYDLSDEVEAYSLQAAFESAKDISGLITLVTGFSKQDAASVQKTGATMAQNAYSTLKTMSSVETGIAMWKLVKQSFSYGIRCNATGGKECLIDELYIQKTDRGYEDTFTDFQRGYYILKR